jgi:hypothetical protein
MVFFPRRFLGGVLQNMGEICGIWAEKTWCPAGNTVVNLWWFCGGGKHANFLK